MHCANQPKCAYRSAEQISHIYKKSRLYRTASLDGQSRTCYPLLSPPRTEGCHHKGRFNLPHIYKKTGVLNIGNKPRVLSCYSNTIGRSETTSVPPATKKDREQHQHILHS